MDTTSFLRYLPSTAGAVAELRSCILPFEMATTEALLQLMQQQLKQQNDSMVEQQRQHAEQMKLLTAALSGKSTAEGATASSSVVSTWPSFGAFDAMTELWSDYWSRFLTFANAHSIPETKRASVLLTNQSPTIYKMLSTLAAQQTPPVDINDLPLDAMEAFMQEQFHPTRFVVRERFKFWSKMQRKPGESVHELASRIRQDAMTCDFDSITKPQDEAMRTRFICSINNEAVLKAVFKVKDTDLTFAKAIEVALEVEEAAKVAKETVCGTAHIPQGVHAMQKNKEGPKKEVVCFRCGKKGHKATECRHKESTCSHCQKKGHLEKACLQKKKGSKPVVRSIYSCQQTFCLPAEELHVTIQLEGHPVKFEVDTGSGDSFIGKDAWREMGQPSLSEPRRQYKSASQHPLPVLGILTKTADQGDVALEFNVTKQPRLNLLGRRAIQQLGLSVDALLGLKHSENEEVNNVFDHLKPDTALQQRCKVVCDEFPDLFKPELGKLKDFELEVCFKEEAKSVFCKPRSVPFAIQEDLVDAYETGIKRGIWERTQFCADGTPVVPIRKALLPGQMKAKLRVCGDYSVTVNPQLEPHRQPMPSPEVLMQRLSGGYGFTKIDLADAYNQIPLGPVSQKRLALSTHTGVLLQKRLPFGITSAPGYFQEVMEQLTADLSGVAVYLDDILVSGKDAEDHLANLRALLKRLNEKGLRARLEKCEFAQPYVHYLGHLLSNQGVAKGSKLDAVLEMPSPNNVSELKSFLGSMQFYGKFLPDASTIAEPLHQLTKKDVEWKWGPAQIQAFETIKRMLSSENVLAHFNPKEQIGISCDASNVGIGAVLFHRYADGTERPICNASKTLTETQRNYSQVQKEALAIIFALKKFHQFLYGRHFLLITDHKPLLSLFGPNKATPAMAANRLARWALLLSQYSYQIEYRRTSAHGNADALSRLPSATDTSFDNDETGDEADQVCMVNTIGSQLDPLDSKILTKESSKDPLLATVMRYCREGWPERCPENPYWKVKENLSVTNGCLFHGARLVIPESLRERVLEILHISHMGMQRMKQLARTAVYWPGIDAAIVNLSQRCTTCGEHQDMPAKAPVHPWIIPDKPWIRIHVDHAINFLGTNWLIVVDSYSKYPTIHQTTSTSTRATTELLEQDFAHFGYPLAVVTDNATTFTSGEFQEWCRSRGIAHLTGAPYHPATNGAAERMVGAFKKAMKKSKLAPRLALQEFLMMYRRTPTPTGYSPSELLNGRQIRTLIDALVPSPSQFAQQRQQKTKVCTTAGAHFDVGDTCYALCFRPPGSTATERWVEGIIVKASARTYNVRIPSRGQVWRRHLDQLRVRHLDDEQPSSTSSSPPSLPKPPSPLPEYGRPKPPSPLPEYGRHNPRRTQRARKPNPKFSS